MATPQLPTAKKLKCKVGRDPLVNDDPILSDEDYAEYLKEYLEDNLKRMENLKEKLTARNETVEMLEAKVKEMSANPYSSRGYQIYKEILNGATSSGLFNPDNLVALSKAKGNVHPDVILNTLIQHFAGVAEIAVKQSVARF